jgi:predicted nuclease of predicted toxin-antitoxin system
VIRLLLDENISPALVRKLADMGVYAQSVPHVGLSGRLDHEIWKYALEHDFAVVTTNARDFILLLNLEVHPGLIVLRESGLTRNEQWDRIKPVVRHVNSSGGQDFLLNKLVEINGVGRFWIRSIPSSYETRSR